jgi:kynureninase
MAGFFHEKMRPEMTRSHAEGLDAADPLARHRDAFVMPAATIYLDGNSLGPLPRGVPARMQRAVEEEWGRGLIRSWNDAGWYPAPLRAGAKIARLIGAHEHEVAVCDSTSVNLFKVLVAGLRKQAGRKVIVAEAGDFPTDGYVAAGVAGLLGAELRSVAPEQVSAAIREAGAHLALVQLTQVNYRSGFLHNMTGITREAHAQGGLAVWDLCHSAGAMPVDLNGCGADFAVGCGYKYLNGGPGAPAYVFVAERHLAELRQPIQGWHGHAAPFGFQQEYRAHPGIGRMLAGTAPQLSLIALEEALAVFEGVDLQAVRRKGVSLCELFIQLAETELAGHGFGLASPRDAARRGSQVSLTHPHGYAIVQALIARGVIGDFRAPDILRFGFAPLYVRHVDVWDAVSVLKELMRARAWDRPEFRDLKAVT